MKRFISLLVCITIIFNLIGCSNQQEHNNTSINLLTSFYPVYIMTLNITNGIENVNVNNMSNQNTGCLHDFQIQPEDMKNIEKANAFIINGVGMESFMDKITNELPNLKVIDSSVDIELLKSKEYKHENHKHSEYNTHIWVSISNYMKQVENICDSLINLDPYHESEYKKNTEIYLKKLNKLRDDMSNAINSTSKKDIITFHDSFPYFAKEFGLNIVEVINGESGSEPNAQEISSIIKIIQNSDVDALFVEPQYPLTTANVISSETNLKIYTLDPAVTGDANLDSYIKTMYANLNVLKEALH